VFTLIDYLRIVSFMINKRSKTFHIQHDSIEKSLKQLIISLAVLFFIVAYLQNLNLFDGLAAFLRNEINEPRELGESVYTFKSLLLFTASIAGGIFIARLIRSAVDTDSYAIRSKQRSSVGRLVLLVRFSILTAGFIIGIIASGIPLTQLTVFMGALGIGLGFGLQNIFNNLVSGLIISIENPVAVGDTVILGTDSGWIKKIGIRSSTIQTFEGSDIIVPNGELISNRLTNRSASNKQSRLEIKISVAYKSDPYKVNALLKDILNAHNEILNQPEPSILFTSLENNALEFSLYFWISDFPEGKRIRSEVLFRIYDGLKENNIEIPFPQKDFHQHSVDQEITVKKPE
jgi:potassium-dependent mechanosensitive channel